MKKKLLITISLAALFCLINLIPANAHGTKYSVITGGVGVQAQYSDGSPMSDSEVKVYSLGEKDPYLKGVTDAKGRFFFMPDKKGKWKVNVDDGMGHVNSGIVFIDDIKKMHVVTGSSSLSNIQKGVMAILFLWGAVGTALYFMRKRN